jgi:hypothetical protein
MNLICFLIWMLVFPLVWNRVMDVPKDRETQIGVFVLFVVFWFSVGLILLLTT